MAADELVPVAEMLLSCPAAKSWWKPVARDDQRVMSFDWADAFLGKDLRQAIVDATIRHKSENAARTKSERDERERQDAEAKGIRYGGYWWSLFGLAYWGLSVEPESWAHI